MHPTATGPPFSPAPEHGSDALEDKRGDGEVKHKAESAVKCGTKQTHKNKGKGSERNMLPFIASLWGRIREIRQKRDLISPYQGRHITLAHPVATQQLQGSFSQPANICD